MRGAARRVLAAGITCVVTRRCADGHQGHHEAVNQASFPFDPAGPPRGRRDTFAAACNILRGVLGRHYPLPHSLPEPLVDEGDDAETCPSRLCLVDLSLQNTRRYPLERLVFFQGVAGGGGGWQGTAPAPPRPAKEKYCPYVGGKYTTQYVIENQSPAGGYVFYHDVTSRKISHWKETDDVMPPLGLAAAWKPHAVTLAGTAGHGARQRPPHADHRTLTNRSGAAN